MDKSGRGRCSGDKRWPNLSIWRLLYRHIRLLFHSSASPLISSHSFHRNPHTSRSQHPRVTSHIRLSTADSGISSNETQLVTSQFTFKRILHKQSIKISPYWKQCNVLEWFVLENDKPNPLFYVPCVFLCFCFMAWIWFEREKSLSSNDVKNLYILHRV